MKHSTDGASLYEHALADEILAEVARQRLTAKSVQESSGVKARAWSNYLTARTRELPMPAVIRICMALGVPASEMLRRAEVRAAEIAAQEPAPTLGEHVSRQTSLEAQEQIRAARARVAKRQG